MNKTYPAYKVMNAIYSTFLNVGNKEYAKNKTNNFLNRCGADINKPKEQPLSTEHIREIVHAMLDENTEKIFWRNLY